MYETDTSVFFYGNKDPFSNFFRTPFTYDGQTFQSSEQCFMYQKAKFFCDNDNAARIVNETNPAAAKALGRKVRNFKDSVWLGHRKKFMTDANLEKFRQNPALAAVLLATGDKRLAEASPRDRIWGIGMGVSNPKINDRAAWKGLNLLGQVLEDVRVILNKNIK